MSQWLLIHGTLKKYYDISSFEEIVKNNLHFASQEYAGILKCHNVCKRHIAIETGFKQTECTIFLYVISVGQKL